MWNADRKTPSAELMFYDKRGFLESTGVELSVLYNG